MCACGEEWPVGIRLAEPTTVSGAAGSLTRVLLEATAGGGRCVVGGIEFPDRPPGLL